MRDIRVSIEVFARIWALRAEEESDEDQILRRVLGVGAKGERTTQNTRADDRDSDQLFPQGFRIFRRYSGRRYEAIRKGGGWYFVHDKKLYPSINRMSVSIGIRNENVWTNWEYEDSEGVINKIDELRPEDHVRRRKFSSPTILDLDGLDL